LKAGCAFADAERPDQKVDAPGNYPAQGLIDGRNATSYHRLQLH